MLLTEVNNDRLHSHLLVSPLPACSRTFLVLSSGIYEL